MSTSGANSNNKGNLKCEPFPKSYVFFSLMMDKAPQCAETMKYISFTDLLAIKIYLKGHSNQDFSIE